MEIEWRVRYLATSEDERRTPMNLNTAAYTTIPVQVLSTELCHDSPIRWSQYQSRQRSRGGKKPLEIRHPGLYLEHILDSIHNCLFPALVLLDPENLARITRLESRKRR